MLLTFQILLILLIIVSLMGTIAELANKKKDEASYYLIVCVTSLASLTAIMLFN